MFATSDRQPTQLILLPGETGAERAAWGEAALAYALAFGGMLFRPDLTGLDLRTFDHVTLIKPEAWPATLPAALSRAVPGAALDLIPAPTPEALRAVLNVRVYYGWRYGPQTRQDWAAAWPRGVCLAGLHGRANGELQADDLPIVSRARMEAVKITSHATMESVRNLWAANPDLFILVRPIAAFTNHDQPRRVTPEQFVEWTAGDLARLYDADSRIRYVEIHNEPNLRLEGLGGSWADGEEFGRWFLRVMVLYRQRFPAAKFGFPGLSPGPALRQPQRAAWGEFLDGCAFAALQADWIGIHSYWVNQREMFDHDLGYAWVDYRRRFPEKLLFITEFGNPRDLKPAVGQQYARYYTQLRRVEGLGAAFSYVVSTSDTIESPRWAWRDESGRDVGIAAAVGRR
ncbi:MAG: hypothetical protein HY784_06610 [Chloroflexi bacterium]|nr:hypothetical protein [Chloroflexota bacterium]